MGPPLVAGRFKWTLRIPSSSLRQCVRRSAASRASSPRCRPRARRSRHRAAVERAGLAAERIDEVLMGNVLPAGQGQAPARQAMRGAGLPDATGATTINKVCGSGMKATMLAHDLIAAGSADIIVAGGMESMTNAPYLLAKARSGYRAGHDRILDHMLLDGLEDAYETGRSMGDFGEATAERLPVHARRPGRLRGRDADRARARRERRRASGRDRADHCRRQRRRQARCRRREPAEGVARQDPAAEAGIPPRRHHHARPRPRPTPTAPPPWC